MKHSLAPQGLSMTQAQSISNLCNQKALDIQNTINAINNSTKNVKIDGYDYKEQVGVKMPADIKELVLKKAEYHATQAFLMHNIKAKEMLLKEAQSDTFVSTSPEPELPKYQVVELKPTVSEVWGWEQLTLEEYNDYLYNEAIASHIGQFFHNGSKLDSLRKELLNIKELEWIEVKDGEKTPVKVVVHHDQNQLADLHEYFATLHRTYEQKVNYYKAKVKNLITLENARIAKENTVVTELATNSNNVLRENYTTALNAHRGQVLAESTEFQEKKELHIKEIASLRISVDPRVKPMVDYFLNTMPKEGE